MLSGGTTMFQVIIERTTKEQMVLFPVTREGHGSERLVSRGWPSIPQHGDQAYNAVVKVRIWISRLCFSDALLYDAQVQLIWELSLKRITSVHLQARIFDQDE